MLHYNFKVFGVNDLETLCKQFIVTASMKELRALYEKIFCHTPC